VPFTRRFFRASALCSLLAVAGIALQLALSGYPSGGDAEGLMLTYADPVFQAQGWVILFQVMFMFFALWGVCAARFTSAPGLIATAVAFLLLWQVLELVPRSVDVIAAAGTWAPAWAGEADPVRRASLQGHVLAWNDVWSAIGVVRRLVWGSSHLVLALAFITGRGLERWIGCLFLLNAARLLPRTIAWIAGWEPGAALLAGSAWFFVGMIPLFALLALWLWRIAPTRTSALRSEGLAGTPTA
jgi:hypothetical protein